VHQVSGAGAIQAMPSLVITTPLSRTASNWTVDASLHSALSADTNRIAQWVDSLRKPSPASLTRTAVVVEGHLLEAKVFEALADAKILTSQVAMHLERSFRDRLFRQLDSLHDTAEWEDGDEPVNRSSFQTFLKAILIIKPERRPGLGLSHTGNLIAAWTTGRDRLTIEFLPNDRVSWVVALYRDNTDEPARFAGQTSVSELVEGLAPHRPEHWFSHAAGTTQEPSR
jgi:hypothetical protein